MKMIDKNIIMISRKSNKPFDYADLLREGSRIEIKANHEGVEVDEFLKNNFISEQSGFTKFLIAYINVILSDNGVERRFVNAEISETTDRVTIIQDRVILPKEIITKSVGEVAKEVIQISGLIKN